MTARLAAVLAIIVACLTAPAANEPVLVAREVYLMGTRASLSTVASTRESGRAALEGALRALEAAERQLSTWVSDSPISRLNRHPAGVPWPAERALCDLFEEIYRWRDDTGGAFDPGIGRLLEAWDIHGEGRRPSELEVTAALTVSGLGKLDFDRVRCTLTRTSDMTIDVGAFGKGEALDRAAVTLGLAQWMIDLGGQVSVGGLRAGDPPWTVGIAEPRNRERAYLTVSMREGSLSTSAGSERDVIVGGTRVGHILDPATGHPAPFSGSVTVWHQRGLAADALSTALFVMGPDKGLAWAIARGISACYLIPIGDTVQVRATPAFSRLLTPESARLTGPE